MKLITILICVFILINCTQNAQDNDAPSPEIEVATEFSEIVDDRNAITDLDESVVQENDSDVSCKTNFEVYISDPGEVYTNVRNAPSGDVIMELRHGDEMEEYMLTIVEAKNGWFKFENSIYCVDRDLEVPGGFGWVHNSVVATDTRNYGNQVISLYETADQKSNVTGTIEVESGGLRVLDACEDWVLIELKYDDYYRKGWMNTEWCCGNPYTNCN